MSRKKFWSTINLTHENFYEGAKHRVSHVGLKSVKYAKWVYWPLWRRRMISAKSFLFHKKILFLPKVIACQRSVLLCNCIVRATFNRDFLEMFVFKIFFPNCLNPLLPHFYLNRYETWHERPQSNLDYILCTITYSQVSNYAVLTMMLFYWLWQKVSDIKNRQFFVLEERYETSCQIRSS